MLKRTSICFLKRFETFVSRTKLFGVVHAWSACAGRERLDRPVVRRGREARREGGPGPEPRLDVLVDLAKPESPGAGGEGAPEEGLSRRRLSQRNAQWNHESALETESGRRGHVGKLQTKCTSFCTSPIAEAQQTLV